jgi:hypothetical protein
MATADPSVASWTPINMWAMLRALINNNCPILTFSGAPTNGTSGTFNGQAGPGSILIDYTNGNIYVNAGTLASPTWIFFAGNQQYSWQPLTVNGAIPINQSRQYIITKVGVLADTIAAPAASPSGDGVEIIISSDNANLHTITFTGNTLDSGSAAVLTATFNANKGATLTIVSYNGRWKVVSANGVSFS